MTDVTTGTNIAETLVYTTCRRLGDKADFFRYGGGSGVPATTNDATWLYTIIQQLSQWT